MNAIVKEFPGEEGTFFRANIPEPTPGYGQVKVKVMAASICASDVHALFNGLMGDRYSYPVIIGHEGAGEVVAVGEGVTTIKVGDRIAVMNAGVIQHVGTPKNIYQRPANLFVSTFIGRSNVSRRH